jgi:MoxR-like ATPase
MITLGYPTTDEEIKIVEDQRITHPIDTLQPVTGPAQIIEVQDAVREVYVDDLIKRYVVSITERTRDQSDISLGCSPRGSLGLFRGAQALALIRGRDYVLPDDVKELAVAVLSHRIVLTPAARMRGVRPEQLVNELLNSVPVPGAR